MTRITPEDARSLITTLSDDRTRLAERIVAPWWLHFAMAVAAGALVFSYALPSSASDWTLIPPLLIIVPAVIVYRPRYRMGTSRQAGRRSTILFAVWSAVLFACGAAAVVIRRSDAPAAWGLVPVAVAMVATVVWGRAQNAALRHHIMRGDDR